MVCPKCETVLKDGETVCPICGTPVDTKHIVGSNLNLAVDAKNTSNARNTGNSNSVKHNISNKYNDNLKQQDISYSSNMPLPQNHDAMPNKEKKKAK